MDLKNTTGEPDKKCEVLIVEDNPEITNFLQALLANRYCVAVAPQGKNAIDYIETRDSDIDVVVLDYRLPDMSGLEVLRKIRRMKPHIPVIFITGYGDEEVAVKAFRYGVRDYLKKPFSYDEFLRTLERSLSTAFSDKDGAETVFLDERDGPADGIGSINSSAIKYNLQRAVIYINNNYMSKISLDKVAREACASKYHFSREFKKSLGCTYKDYVNKIRMEKAKELLKSTKMSITEAAFSVGYPDLTNFERIFKRIMGCTPKEYKNRETEKGPDFQAIQAAERQEKNAG